MTRYIVHAADADYEVIGDEFTIEGFDEKFIVHHSLDRLGEWVSTHLRTGFFCSRGSSIDTAIDNASKLWLAKTPEKIASALALATQSLADRNARLAAEAKRIAKAKARLANAKKIESEGAKK